VSGGGDAPEAWWFGDCDRGVQVALEQRGERVPQVIDTSVLNTGVLAFVALNKLNNP
jgi:hypothetical protein